MTQVTANRLVETARYLAYHARKIRLDMQMTPSGGPTRHRTASRLSSSSKTKRRLAERALQRGRCHGLSQVVWNILHTVAAKSRRGGPNLLQLDQEFMPHSVRATALPSPEMLSRSSTVYACRFQPQRSHGDSASDARSLKSWRCSGLVEVQSDVWARQRIRRSLPLPRSH